MICLVLIFKTESIYEKQMALSNSLTLLTSGVQKKGHKYLIKFKSMTFSWTLDVNGLDSIKIFKKSER